MRLRERRPHGKEGCNCGDDNLRLRGEARVDILVCHERGSAVGRRGRRVSFTDAGLHRYTCRFLHCVMGIIPCNAYRFSVGGHAFEVFLQGQVYVVTTSPCVPRAVDAIKC